MKLGIGFLKLARNPENTPAVFDISDSLLALGALTGAKAKFAKDPEALQIIRERKLIFPFHLDELVRMPEGSLGRTYAEHMISQKLDPNFFRNIEIKNDAAFVAMRMRQTHDLWHVVTGFQTSVPGELGLQAFVAAQTSLPLAPILISGALLKVGVRNSILLEPIMNEIVRGWQMGLKSKPLFSFDWEANWQTPVSKIREQHLL
ncbi:MAG: Coq4 family protein [Pseudobdellovibrionaceae bacterium]